MAASAGSGAQRGRPQLHVLADRAALTRRAAEIVAAAAEEAVSAHGAFHLVLSGGSTPRALYELLADEREPFRARIDWRRTHLFWGDERPVPPDHPESNFRMAREALLDRVPVPASQVHRMRGEADPAAAADDYEQHLRRFFDLPASLPDHLPDDETPGPPASRLFDLALFGLGPEGHTASLFPLSPALAERRRLCVAPWVASHATFRITLTPAAFAGAERALFLVAGADKAEALARTLAGAEPPERCPALAIRPRAGGPVWLADRDAARLVGPPR